MIKLENINVLNWDGAIRGMRNPLNSWDKSDSERRYENVRDHIGELVIGENDLALMRKLCRAGSDHRKFLRQILVSMDITAPLYWWKEADQYKVGTTTNSCSTMHTIHKKPLELDDFSHEHLITPAKDHLERTIRALNEYLSMYTNWDSEEEGIRKAFGHNKKNVWLQIIQLLPTSYNQKRTVTLNYEVLLNIYHARRHHKLPEWHTMCDTIADMPYFYDICLSEGKTNA